MQKYEASFHSLRNYECPTWFKNAKFGIWSNWGPQSVPMMGDWYARNMYIQGTAQNRYHTRVYGHPSEFGYKDLVKLWKAEKFDPDLLIEKFYNAGARYFVVEAMHHDHFFNFDSDLNPMNSTKIGPMKDICGMWKAAAKKYDLPFGITEHLGASFSWWRSNKGWDTYGPYKGVPYDGNDPEHRAYYFDNYEHFDKPLNPKVPYETTWYTTNKKFHTYWGKVMKEIIDKYEPDLLYSDGGLPFGPMVMDEKKDVLDEEEHLYKEGLEMLSYYYNQSLDKYGENRYVYTQKDRREKLYTIGILDIECGQLPDIRKYPWQTDSCIGGWFYSSTVEYKKPQHLIEMLVDIISKNGNLMLNIIQKPDGSLDAEAEYILEELAKWFAVCAEGVHGTTPWKRSGEGYHQVDTDEGFTEGEAEQIKIQFNEYIVPWDASDMRFTRRDNTVYAFMMRTAKNKTAILKSFTAEAIKSVSLLGYGAVEFHHEFGILTVKLPEEMPTEYANCLAIELDTEV